MIKKTFTNLHNQGVLQILSVSIESLLSSLDPEKNSTNVFKAGTNSFKQGKQVELPEAFSSSQQISAL